MAEVVSAYLNDLHRDMARFIKNSAAAQIAVTALQCGITPLVRLGSHDAHVANRLLDAGDYAALWITDSGAGMSAEVEGRAFDPLFSTKAEGRGLGLPASLRIAVSHGGGIRVDTAPAEGTTVTVYLPPHFSPSAV